jgi:hypothetical protein
MITSTPFCFALRAAESIAYVLPTPAEAPKKIYSLPRCACASSSFSRASIWSGSGRVSVIGSRRS